MRSKIVFVVVVFGGASIACGPSLRVVPETPSSVVTRERRIPSDVPGVDLVVTMRATRAGYAAHTESGVALTDPYAIERDADKGLVHLHCIDGAGADQRAQSWNAEPGSFGKVISLRYDTTVLDRWDVLVSDTRLRFVHTTWANAGVFVVSDVYELPRLGSPLAYKRVLEGQSEECAPEPFVLAEALRFL